MATKHSAMADKALKVFLKKKSIKDVVKSGSTKELRIGDYYFIYGNRELLCYDDNFHKGKNEDAEPFAWDVNDYGQGWVFLSLN